MDAHDAELELHGSRGRRRCPGPDPDAAPGGAAGAGYEPGERAVRWPRAGQPVPLGPAPLGTRPIRREVIRLDVDGRYPQMTVSGTIIGVLVSRIHWVARLRRIAPNRFQGSIWYKDGAATSFPYTTVEVTATPSRFPADRRVKIVFSGGGAAKRTVEYSFTSGYFRTVNFEFDVQSGEVLDTAIDTSAHPIRPAGCRPRLSIQTVYRRVGCQVTTNPPSIVGARARRHLVGHGDARRDAGALVALRQHGAVGDVGLLRRAARVGHEPRRDHVRRHRPEPPAGDGALRRLVHRQPAVERPQPGRRRDRMRFWTAVHEMGHAFNLAHSWQKAGGSGWVPLENEPEARSS